MLGLVPLNISDLEPDNHLILGIDKCAKIPGPTGPTGDVGPPGAVGLTGGTGIQGIQGPIGLSLIGLVGATGSTGLAGKVGNVGLIGPTGPAGQIASSVESITGNTVLANNGISILNSYNYSYNVTLGISTTGSYKSLILDHATGSEVIINTPQGSLFVAPGLPVRNLVYTNDLYWTSLDPGYVSLFSTGVFQANLVGTGNTGNSQQGFSVALSADGNTLAVGGISDNGYIGATWIFTRSNGVWVQQGNKLVSNDYSGNPNQGKSVALSADGNTLAVGGPNDNSLLGATWIFTRSNGVWTQQGSKLIGSGSDGFNPNQGWSVSLSADGNTLAVGGRGDGTNDTSLDGATWIFTRSNGVWAQQGSKLVGTGNTTGSQQGYSVSLSADGNTLAVGGVYDGSLIIAPGVGPGATWIFTRSDGVWTQQGNKLVGSNNTGAPNQGSSVSLSPDANTLAIGSGIGSTIPGGTWVFIYFNGTWVQQGDKIVANDYIGNAQQGNSVFISADGNTMVIAGPNDNSGVGATWIFSRVVDRWIQQGNKIIGSVSSLALSTLGDILAIGNYSYSGFIGSTLIYT